MERDAQLELIAGYYRCHNCGDLAAARVRKTHRWRLCDACWAQIMPAWEQQVVKERPPAWYVETEEQRAAIGAYWEWYTAMERRYPTRFRPSSQAPARPQREADELIPVCRCGRPREAVSFAAGEGGLFGGPFRKLCPVCNAHESVRVLANGAAYMHPEWDDEDWLDHLLTIYPKYFELGVLPDAWLEARAAVR